MDEEDFFGEFYADALSDCLSDMYTSVSEDEHSSKHSLIQTIWILNEENKKKCSDWFWY